MKASKLIKATGLLVFIAVLLISGGCDNLGIFAVVAVTDKIDDGSLPEGISAKPIVQIPSGLLAAPAVDYAAFASGPGFWAKDLTDSDNYWLPKALIDGNGLKWDGIQAIAVSDSDLYMALYKVDADEAYTVALHRLDSFDGTTLTLEALGGDSSWSSTASTYETIRMYCPDPDPDPAKGRVYINVLEHRGEYGTIDSDDTGFVRSNLYTIAGDATSLDIASDGIAEQKYLNGSSGKRYVTGVASDGAVVPTILITATDNFFSSVPSAAYDVSAGILLDGSGNKIPLTGEDSTVSTTGIIWLPNVDASPDVGAFVASATAFDDNDFPMFASHTGLAGSWVKITNGTSTEYLTTNFIDVSMTTAGSAEKLALAGTSSYIDGSTGRYARGYQEIRTAGLAIADWYVNNSAADYDFARNNNYAASELSLTTITGMTMINGVLYAATRNAGIWSIEPDSEEYPSWTRE